MTPQLSPAQRRAVSKISGLVLINAMIFQEILADPDKRVLSLQEILDHENLLDEFSNHWQYILTIDYYPIFNVARKILLDLTSSHDVVAAMRELARTAQRLVSMRAALRHDLMGRVYHRLLVDAKFLGTFYTSIPAASLLLKLALRPDAWPIEWQDLEQVRNLRVADLACGTGTLLMAAADSLSDNHISASASEGQAIDLTTLHTILAEDVLHGYDVLASAIHLTASTLALRHPQIAFTKMNLFSLPLGGPEHRLGSIEFISASPIPFSDVFGATQQMTGEAVEESEYVPHPPELDLCVMNPPFTRSVGGNLLFGSMPEKERGPMQTKLKRLVKKTNTPANITAGLGSVFVAIADRLIKDNGRIALVLPKALLSGVAWGRTRELLTRRYTVDYLVVSHDPERWNFSESTNLSEVLLVASKVGREGPPQDGRVVVLNLWRSPSTTFEALAIAHELMRHIPPDVRDGQGALEICLGQEKVGEAIAIPWAILKAQTTWMLPCAFAQSDVTRAVSHLLDGRLWLPGYGTVGQVPFCSLDQLGALGPDARDIHDGFKLSRAPTPYPAFWGHSTKSVTTMAQEPNNHLLPLPKAKSDRKLRRVEALWPLAGKVLLAERLRFNTQRLFAVRLPKKVLSSVWWELSFREELISESSEKVLILWLNSTLGLLLLLTHRVETEGAWMKLKKPTLARLPVLDLSVLSRDQLDVLTAAYDRLADQELQPFPEMNTDAVRAEIDRSIAQALDLPDYSVLRELLSQEPVVCLRRL